MKLIATHNSATGEQAGGFLSWLLTPFARCQSKTILEQYENGCRLFDFRVRYDADGNLVPCHGAWECKRLFLDVLNGLRWYPDVNVCVTYEGELDNESAEKFLTNILRVFQYHYTLINLSMVAVKKPTWHNLYVSPTCVASRQGFLSLDGTSWHTYLPIPWLWDRLYSRPHQFSEALYTYVDFL